MKLVKLAALLVSALTAITALPAAAEELVIWNRTMSAREEKALRTIMQQFEAANAGVTVKLETRSVDEHKSALRIAAAS